MRILLESGSIRSDLLLQLDEKSKSIRRVGLDFDGDCHSLLPLLDIRFPGLTKVAILRCVDYEPSQIRSALERAIDILDLTPRLGCLAQILIKPALVEARRAREHATTHPVFLAELIRVLRDLSTSSAEILVAEGAGHERDTQAILLNTGIGKVIETLDVPFVDLNFDDIQQVVNPSPLTSPAFWLPYSWLKADYHISLARLKTHHRTAVSLGMKNLFGCVPGSVYGFPKNKLHWMSTPRSIVDLATLLRPELTIIDGIIGMEGDGPLNGATRRTGVIIVGINVASVDIVATRLIGFSPLLIPKFWYALKKNLLEGIELVGDVGYDLEEPFVAPKNISWLASSAMKSQEEQINTLLALLDEGENFRATYRSFLESQDSQV
jgi:uncharacterized protein (DUF362 family)